MDSRHDRQISSSQRRTRPARYEQEQRYSHGHARGYAHDSSRDYASETGNRQAQRHQRGSQEPGSSARAYANRHRASSSYHDYGERSTNRVHRRENGYPPARRASSTIPPNRRSAANSSKSNTILIGGIVCAIIVVAIAIFAVTQYSPTEPSPEPASTFSDDQTNDSMSDLDQENSNGSTDEVLVPNRAALMNILETEDVDKLIARAQTNEDALWIAAHPEEYAFEGTEVQYKILKLAANEEAALEYVREFPEKYPASDETLDLDLAMGTRSPNSAVPNTSVPHIYQWDRRWAQTIYCSTTFGLTGCGPTALAMVYQGLTGDDTLDPYELGLMAQESGYMLQFDGTTDGFFTQTANEIGLNYETLAPTVENITQSLANGKPIIANFAPGYFTKYGHFVVLAGLDSNGQIIMNDPYSVVRSSQTWDPDLIANETRKMFVYSAA